MKKYLLTLFLMSAVTINSMAQCVTCANSTANGDNASAIGIENQANAINSKIIGMNSITDGWHSITIGNFNTAYETAVNSFAFGMFTNVVAGQCMVIGIGADNTHRLSNNIQQSLMIGFNSDKPTFFVSRSSGYNKTGKIGIGNITEPEAKLHLRADEGEKAAIFIESHNWESGDTATVYLGNKANGISADSLNGMVYSTENSHVFKGGDVYIEEIDKGIIMKSPDGKCWRGTLDNNGLLGFVRLDACPGQTVAVKEHSDNGDNTLKIYPNPAGDFVTVSIQKREHHLQTIKLLNENGITLVTKNISGNSTRFYTGDLPTGTYIIQVNSGDKRRTGKFLKR